MNIIAVAKIVVISNFLLTFFMIVNFYFLLTRATFKTKKCTTKLGIRNSDKMIYFETCTTLFVLVAHEKHWQCMVAAMTAMKYKHQR